MRIPRHWTRASAPSPVPGARGNVVAWGWSETGMADAERVARERLERQLERLRAGEPPPNGYAYGDRPLREEIVEEVAGESGPAAIVTRNTYGALVLNTDRAMFVDVDLPPPPPRAGGLLARLFGAGRNAGRDAARAAGEEEQLALLRQRLGALRGDFRIYRTAGGFRVLATDRTHEPASNETRSLMEQMGADPAYRQLCRVQESFRARLTPKPWRCALHNPPGQHPRAGSGTEESFARWLAGYEAACASRATCRYLETIGSERVHRDVRELLALHDERTRALESLPLA